LRADIRVIAATNRDLRAAMEGGTFREDLYYRLQVFEIGLPPLRERRDDVLPLSEAFLQDIAHSFGRPPAGIAREARDGLLSYHWPGNVRELRNMLERAAILCEGGLITREHLSCCASPPARAVAGRLAPSIRSASAVAHSAARPPAASGDLQSMERAAIERALEGARYNKSRAAKELGLTRKQLYARLRQHGLS
jgi:DNA-binding NtrC family response regulator